MGLQKTCLLLPSLNESIKGRNPKTKLISNTLCDTRGEKLKTTHTRDPDWLTIKKKGEPIIDTDDHNSSGQDNNHDTRKDLDKLNKYRRTQVTKDMCVYFCSYSDTKFLCVYTYLY